MVDTPAGIFLTRAEVELVHRWGLHDNTDEARNLKRRINKYLDSQWQAQATARAAAIEKGLQ